jgi:hypothetical protein
MTRAPAATEPFRGWIAATGTTRGPRVVVGSWDSGPFGRVDDVMVAHPDGRRVLYAPLEPLAQEITSRYRFEEVVLGDVHVSRGRTWRVQGPEMDLELGIGRRTALGRLLALQPSALREQLWWARLCDPIARRVMPGVRTAVRNEEDQLWYAASDHRLLSSVSGTLAGVDIGAMAPVEPAVDFGGSAAPSTPSLTRIASYRR